MRLTVDRSAVVDAYLAICSAAQALENLTLRVEHEVQFASHLRPHPPPLRVVRSGMPASVLVDQDFETEQNVVPSADKLASVYVVVAVGVFTVEVLCNFSIGWPASRLCGHDQQAPKGSKLAKDLFSPSLKENIAAVSD